MDRAAEVQAVPMTRAEAEAAVKDINAAFSGYEWKVLEFRRRDGGQALGYDSWESCARGEFEHHRTRINQVLAAEGVRDAYGNNGRGSELIANTSEWALRPLTPHRDEPELIRDAFDEALKLSDGKPPTQSQVKQAVDAVLASQGFPISAPKLNGALPGQTTFLGEQKETNEPEADPDLSAWEKWVDARFTFFASIDRRGGVVDYTKRWSESQRSQLAAILEHCIERMTSYLNDLKEIHS